MLSNRKLRNLFPIAAASALTLVLTGCGKEEKTPDSAQPVAAVDSVGSSAPGDPAGAAPGGAPGAAPSAAGAAPGAAADGLAVREDPQLGPVVTGAGGMTLYRFDKDDPKTAKSNCEGPCAQTWLPTPAGAKAPSGVEAKALGETQRGDGTKQLTINGWPVYRYSKDTAPGETKGQTQPGWGAVAPDGKRAAKPGGGAGQGQRPTGQEPGRGGNQEQGRGRNDGGRGRNEEPTTEVNIIVQPVLGTIVVDSRGRTLYGNGGGRNQRSCRDACLDGWIPVRVREDVRIVNIDRRIIETRELEDRSRQLVINGEPMFVFGGDSVRGDIKGLGLHGCWSAINGSGALVGNRPAR